MSENPFVNELGDALEGAFAADWARKSRRRVWWRRPGVLVAFAVVAIGCGAAVATTLLSSSTLAIHPIECVAGTTFKGEITFPENNGSSPVRICARTLDVPAAKLIACAGGRYTYVSVFYAAGVHQCRRLGLQPLPASYPLAQARVERLGRELLALQASAYCVTPSTFTARARRILDRLGWSDWQVRAGSRVEDEAGVIGGGGCAVLPGATYPLFHPNIRDALDPDHQLLTFDLGPPPTLTRRVETLAVPIQRWSSIACRSKTGLEAFVSGRLAALGLEAAFAFIAEPTYGTLDEGVTLGYGGQARYQRGCPVVKLFRTSAGDLKLVDVLVYQRGAAPPPARGLPPQDDFH